MWWVIGIIVVVFLGYVVIVGIIGQGDRAIFLKNLDHEITGFSLVLDEDKRFIYPWILAKNEVEGTYLLARRNGADVAEKYLFSKDEITYCAIDIDGKRESSGVVSGAVLGGLVFGPLGAVIGGLANKKIANKIRKISLYVGIKGGEPIIMEYKSNSEIAASQKEAILKTYHLFSALAQQSKTISS